MPPREEAPAEPPTAGAFLYLRRFGWLGCIRHRLRGGCESKGGSTDFQGRFAGNRYTVFDILREAARFCPETIEVEELDEAVWNVRVGVDSVEVELDLESARAMFSTRIEAPPVEGRAKIYEAALLYNSLWRDTGSVRLALAEAGGDLVQMVDLSVSELSAQCVAHVLRHLVERAAIWREFARGAVDSPQEALSSDYFAIKI